ncbi:GNAT family N-acetyltransferase [uncultured Thomasclavelia sp.]|uniref:GNAT family N-acetyltransferase n=1 Tax=uncultured Thomasclavelia sp. TaxID=3025759 RepID=UPI0025D14316|nr:GNAT family N-acetyltransferase [uncultured Thomasclavelia sp.]
MDRILQELNKDYVNNVDFIYVYKHGAEVINYDQDLMVFLYHDMYFIKGSQKKVEGFISQLLSFNTLAIHNSNVEQLLKEKFNRLPQIIAYQYCYRQNYVKILKDIKIRPIGIEYLDIVKKYYETAVDEKYLKERLLANVFIGAFVDEKIAGFAGIHDEGSIGFVEVLPQYRHQKIGTALESYLINQRLKNNEDIYLQVAINNDISNCFHQKLGFIQADDIITWY